MEPNVVDHTSMWSLISNASIVVQLVMLTLVAASVTSWIMIFQRGPYVGLFGTVWGIMNSFRGLATVQQATLATVAPGIAEALIATAIGLFAAIPAVIAYNRFSARSEMLIGRYYTFADEFQAILHRKVHTSDD